jgi:hypothetical protein
MPDNEPFRKRHPTIFKIIIAICMVLIVCVGLALTIGIPLWATGYIRSLYPCELVKSTPSPPNFEEHPVDPPPNPADDSTVIVSGQMVSGRPIRSDICGGFNITPTSDKSGDIKCAEDAKWYNVRYARDPPTGNSKYVPDVKLWSETIVVKDDDKEAQHRVRRLASRARQQCAYDSRCGGYYVDYKLDDPVAASNWVTDSAPGAFNHTVTAGTVPVNDAGVLSPYGKLDKVAPTYSVGYGAIGLWKVYKDSLAENQILRGGVVQKPIPTICNWL